MNTPRTLRGVILGLLVTTPAIASDWYVDAVNGNNANGGTSVTDAWRTITFAVAQTPPTGVQTIHIAAGTYDSALGEVFPIPMRPDMQLVGNTGATRPRLDDYNALALIDLRSDASNQVTFGPLTRIEHLELARAFQGIRLIADSGSVDCTVRDMALTDVRYIAIAFDAHGSTSSHLVLEQVHYDTDPAILGPSVGMSSSALNGAQLALSVSDSVFVRADQGCVLLGNVDADFQRCRIERSGYTNVALVAQAPWSLRATFNACSVSASDNYGCRLVPASGSGELHARFERCTVAENVVVGLTVAGSGTHLPQVEIDQSVFANPALDLTIPAASSVSDSLIRDGQFTGANGNFAADPSFVAPNDGDWFLRWNSPCIDLIADAAVAAEVDLAHHLRGVDGNLDRVERSDIGAYEFQPLALKSTGQIATTLELDSWGPQGNASAIYWTRVAPVAAIATPFGDFELDVNLAHIFKTLNVGASAPSITLRQIPNAPQLVGHTYAFQALTDCQAAPLGRAFTNVVSVTFTP